MKASRWAGVLLLTACLGDPAGGGRSPEQAFTGYWALTVRSQTPERIDLEGEVRNTGDSVWYSLGRPRPTTFPPCDPAEATVSRELRFGHPDPFTGSSGSSARASRSDTR